MTRETASGRVIHSRAPYLFVAVGLALVIDAVFDLLLPSRFNPVTHQPHYHRAVIVVLIGVYCCVVAWRIRRKEKRMHPET